MKPSITQTIQRILESYGSSFDERGSFIPGVTTNCLEELYRATNNGMKNDDESNQHDWLDWLDKIGTELKARNVDLDTLQD